MAIKFLILLIGSFCLRNCVNSWSFETSLMIIGLWLQIILPNGSDWLTIIIICLPSTSDASTFLSILKRTKHRSTFRSVWILLAASDVSQIYVGRFGRMQNMCQQISSSWLSVCFSGSSYTPVLDGEKMLNLNSVAFVSWLALTNRSSFCLVIC